MTRQELDGRKDWIGAALIFLATFAVFVLSPVHTVVDSKYAMLFSQHLLWNHSFSLEAQAFPELQTRKPGQIHRPALDLPYQLVQVGERFYYRYPPGNIILPMPFVALANAMGVSAVDQNGIYDWRAEGWMQKRLAALLMAALAAFVFLTSRLLLSFRWSLLIAAATAFGTQVWSTASRSVWSQTWGIFILGVVIWLLVRTEAKQAPLRPVLLATCLSWLYFVRPTFSIAIAGIALYVLIYHRKNLLLFVLTGGIWLTAFIGYSQYHFGQFQPEYYYQTDAFSFSTFFSEGLVGTLISPSRGLLIYVPVLVFVAYLLLRYRASWRPRLVILVVAVVFLHLLMISGFIGWHGGHCYGPRHSTDLVPWFALLGILAVQARLQWREQNRAKDGPLRVRTEWGIALLLLLFSVTLNGIGAVWTKSQKWNSQPIELVDDLSRLWDWRHPPFLGVPDDAIAPVPEPDR